MIEGIVFVTAIIIAVTQFIKLIAPKISGAWIILVAIAVGIVVAVVDTHIGVVDLSIAQGVLAGLTAVGVHTVAAKVGGTSE